MKIYKGNIVFTKDSRSLTCIENGYISVLGGKVSAVSATPPAAGELVDFGDRLIIPSFVDIHLHAPQFENCGIGFDRELLPWLSTYTFPEERKFEDVEYAKAVYSRFAKTLVKYGTTRAVMFATIHSAATELLSEILNASGIGAYVGRVNMDRGADYLNEDTEASLRETEAWLKRGQSPGQSPEQSPARVKPIITPRFTPACTDELLRGLGELAAKYNVPVQSHLSENLAEIELVKELAPGSAHYADTYDRFGLFGDTPTIMAHCVHLTPEEEELIQKKAVFIAHCPSSNLNIMSGIAPVRRYMTRGINVCLGTDVAGGHSLSMAGVIVSAIQSSKIYSVLVEPKAAPLTLSEAFYLATKAGGKFFGSVGSFEAGYDFDALVIDDSDLSGMNARTLDERLERWLYAGSYVNIYKRFAFGNEL